MKYLRLLTIFTILFTTSLSAQDVQIMAPEWVVSNLSDMTENYENLEFITANDNNEMRQHTADVDAIIGWVSRDVVKKGKNLKWIQSPSAGVEGFITIPELVNSDIILTNAQIIMGPEIADHTFALLLTLTRNMSQYHSQMSTASWDRDTGLPLLELRNKTMLIIGLGGIGTQVAERAHAFGMRVLATDPVDKPYINSVETVGKPDELYAFLPEADVIVSAVPHTPTTEQMLSTDEFDAMKDGVILINVSRGKIVDTDALVAGLREGKVAAAGLDVTDPEPLPEGHPLWSMENVIITPHVAGRSDGLGERHMGLFRENVRRFVEGLPLRNVVDKQAGY
jgi:phosphoglycerate dehydrogenase-like enzyme